MFTLEQLRRLRTGDEVQYPGYGRARFVRLRERRAVFVAANGQRINLWLVNGQPPPLPSATVREDDTPPPGARTDDED